MQQARPVFSKLPMSLSTFSEVCLVMVYKALGKWSSVYFLPNFIPSVVSLRINKSLNAGLRPNPFNALNENVLVCLE